MKLQRKHIFFAAAGAAIVGAAGIAWAQSNQPAQQPNPVSEALADGIVGEMADGYLGIKGQVSAAVRAEVDALNIKRRAAYTQLAQRNGVTPRDVGATAACKTLETRVTKGRIYMLPDGVWRTKGDAPIQLPAYCVTS